MTFTCEDNHDPIKHAEFHCPLCAECADHAETRLGLDAAEHQIAGMEEIAEECATADTLQLIARVAELEAWKWKAEQRLNGLDYAINRSQVKGLARQLASIQEEFRKGALGRRP